MKGNKKIYFANKTWNNYAKVDFLKEKGKGDDVNVIDVYYDVTWFLQEPIFCTKNVETVQSDTDSWMLELLKPALQAK